VSRLRIIVLQQAERDYPKHLLGNHNFITDQASTIRKRLQLRDEDEVQIIEDTSEDGIWTLINSSDIDDFIEWFFEFNGIVTMQDLDNLFPEDKMTLVRMMEPLHLQINDLIDMFGLADEEPEKEKEDGRQ
jgi:hypothetical protein